MKTKLLSIFQKPVIVLITVFFAVQLLNGQKKVPDYTSKVPKFSYPITLAEQENQLKTDPLMLRFAESRKRQTSDKYRPIYHFVSPESTLNDPNGICFWQGNWHLFYQGYPPEDRRQHWGHAISKDLIHWKDLPYAIYPGPERAVFSGSSLVDGNRVIAMYHGTEVGNMVAISEDPLLLNWKKTTTDRAAIPLLTDARFPLPYSVFDPCIWKKDSIYYALSAGRAPKGPGGRQISECYLFRSKDLVNWQYVHEFVEGDRFTLINDDYACPYFWPIGDRYIMPFFSHMSGGQYLLGDYDTKRDKFVVTHGSKFNFGPATPSGVHAPSATPDGKGGLIIIFNMNPGKPTGEWNQIFTLPRLLTLAGKNEIRQEPAGDIESLRGELQKVAPMKLPANKEIVLKKIKGNAMEINIEIDPKEAPVIELNVLRSPGREEYTQITFHRERGMPPGRDYRYGEIARVQGVNVPVPVPGPPATPAATSVVRESLLTLETSFASLHPDVRPRGPETGAFILNRDETLKLRIFIDKSVVEVFANGKQCVAARVYPSRDDSIGFSIRSQGQESELKLLEAWQMKSIY
ncbi:MAG: glycosyl hydrolase family 32 domain protein [Bacteroidetes bacterium GWE2_41_25]|nr:MAG: glycosyl hydrolase family 32 domain protein [Bacteroidetes bacterium GWE2_41_25]HBH84683.1 glycosyl hydrolase family 32 domain protein [Bacteroidales bacterium]